MKSIVFEVFLKTIGVIGGLSWHSTQMYYYSINNKISKILGKKFGAKILLHSHNNAELSYLAETRNWNDFREILINSAKILEKAGSDCIILACNTAHKYYAEIQASIQIPIFHIADCVIMEAQKNDVNSIGLISTKETILNDIYGKRLIDSTIKIILPTDCDINRIDEIIFNEISCGILSNHSKDILFSSFSEMKRKGADSIILGCTELGVFFDQFKNMDFYFLDSTKIHSETVALWSIDTDSNISQFSYSLLG